MDGFMTEHGPFHINLMADKQVKLTWNPHSWNRNANVIYLESPVGVGYSYSNNSVDYKSYNDNKTASDNYMFLVKFFERYPQFRSNPFYVSGESYAGHYVPVTTNAVFDGNQRGQNPKINLKGFLVGNGVTHDEADANTVPPFLYNHALISQALYTEAQTACMGNYYKNQKVPACNAAISKMYDTLWSSGINPYNMYGTCEGSLGRPNNINTRSHPLFNMWDATNMKGQNGAPCIDDSDMTQYFNVSYLLI
jgi:serine carboxypeptidase-like clade 1